MCLSESLISALLGEYVLLYGNSRVSFLRAHKTASYSDYTTSHPTDEAQESRVSLSSLTLIFLSYVCICAVKMFM